MNIPQNFKLCAGLLKVTLFLPKVRTSDRIEDFFAEVKSAALQSGADVSVVFRVHDDWQKVMVGVAVCGLDRDAVAQIITEILANIQSLEDVDVMDSFSEIIEF